jgi:hypothetical protein
MTTTTIPNLSLPCGAIKVFDWESPDFIGLDQPVRYFDGTRRVIEIEQPTTRDIEVEIQGQQWGDGVIEREIIVHPMHRDGPISIDQARQLSAAVAAAVEEANLLSTYDKAVSR